MNSHWPKCNKLAEEIYELQSEEAKQALVQALKAKRHHIRTAAIQNLVKFSDPSLAKHIEACLSDSAYETRTEAQKALDQLHGK